ncbi:MAG: type II secretion system F family protein [Lachnospiraceae bacterium]|nr:type II secretion system F family protein [Lachnospiraceae bacterium]
MKKIAEFIYNRLDNMSKKPNKILHDNTVHEALQALEPAGDTQKRQREYVIKKLSLCIIVIIVGLTLSLLLWIKDGTQTVIVDNRIERNPYGDGEKNVTLVGKSENGTYEVDLSVEEKQYSGTELNDLLREFIPLLETNMLGENESFDKVVYDLNLIDGISGFPFTVEWQTDDVYINRHGALKEDILDVPKLVELTAIISCESFEARHELSCMVYSKAVQPSQSEQILKALQKIQSETRDYEFMTLPSEINKEKISWSYRKNYTELLFLIATPLIALILYFGTDRDLKKQVNDRKEQLQLDYPEIVSALALLIGAGMTVPNAWQRVAKDYRARKQETGRKRYAYEEMLLTIYEMESGVAQTKAYERFGRRCRVQCYNRLSTMLSQNVKKGATNLAALLREEAAYAFEERKHTARRFGEKAGTKLLMPMMMLLCMIMIVIMVPAFKTYF